MKRIFKCFVFLFVLIAVSYLQAGEFPKYMFADPYWIYSIAYDPNMTQPMIDSSYYYPQLARLGITHSSTYGDNTSLNNVENIKLFNHNIEKAKYVSGTYIKVKDYTTGQNRDYRVGGTREDPPSYFDAPETGDDIRDGVNGPHVYCALVSQDDIGNLLPLANLGIWRFSREFKFIFRMKMVGDNTSHDPVAEVHIWEDYQILKGLETGDDEESSHQIFNYDPESKGNTTATDTKYIIYSDDFDASGVYQKIESPNISLHYKVEFGGVKRTVRTYIELKWLKNRDLYIDHLWTRDIYNYRMVEAPDSTTWHNKILDYLRPIHNYNPSNNFSWYSDEPRSYMYDSFNKVDDLSRNDPTIGIPLNGATGGGDYVKFSVFISKIQPDELIANRYTITGEHSSSSDVAYENSIQNAFDVYTNNIGDAALACKQYDTDLWPMIQVQSEYRYDTKKKEWDWAYRDPSKNEIKAEVNLSLCYGAKAISYFVYGTGNFGWGTWYYHGLVDNVGGSPVLDPASGDYLPSLYDYTTGVYEPNEKWYAVKEAHEIIDLIADDLLSLDWQNAFTYPDDQIPPGGSAVLSVENTSGLNEYVEIGNFVHSVTGDKYFMLVNRRVQDDNPNDTQTLTVKLESSGATRLIEDVLASRQPWDGDQNRVAYRVLNSGENTFTIALEPGEGRLFRISPGLSGTISRDSYWSGDILIADNITVNQNVTLIINPGVSAKFSSGKKLTVQKGAKIMAEGIEAEPIIFTSVSGASPGSWGGVYVYGSNNIFRHCTFEYGNWALRLQGPASGNKVEHCTFRNNYAGLYIRNNNAEVKSCKIHNNQSYGVYCYNNPEVKFQGNRIYDNLWYGVYSTAGNFLKFAWNVIENNGSGGPSFPLYGIYTRDGDYLRFWSGYGDNTLGYNTIRNNYGYEVVADYGSPRVELGVPTVGGLNAIYDDAVNNPYDTYEVWNRSGNPMVYAWYCWWGINGPQTYGSVSTSNRITSEPGWLGSTGPGGAAKMPASEDKDLKERIKELKKVIVESPDSPEAIEAFSELYGIIRSDLEDELGEKDRFYEYLTELYSKHNSNKLGKFVLRKKIFWKSLEGETEEAIKLSRKALKEFEKAEAEDEDWLSEARMCVLEDLALTYIHTGDIMNGKACLDEVMEKYSFDSTMIALIEEEIEDLENLISEGMMLGKRVSSYREEEEEDEFIPEEYALTQNYPNPFNATTTIPFSLPEESHVKIEIYDLSGSCVATLSDKRYQAGNYNVQFNGSGLASGVYFIRAQMVEKQGKQYLFTSKMMLLK